VIQPFCNRLELVLVPRDAEVFRHLLPNQPVGVLHRGLLPGAARGGAEEALGEVLGDLVMVCHLAPRSQVSV
jgi:hypothetical protein